MKEIPGALGYFATLDGQIVSFRMGRARYLAAAMNKGYLHVWVRFGYGRSARRRLPVHQLVLMAWRGLKPFDGAVTRHLDGNALNNAPSNLVWGTAQENMQDSIRHGTAVCIRTGEAHPRTRLRDGDVIAIKSLLTHGMTQSAVAASYGVSQRHISAIKLNQSRCPLGGANL